ncbi:response regulator [Sphingomonas sp. RS2018]
MTILYVDDDADMRTIVALSLSLDPDITVGVAASGREGLEILADGPSPDAVILDVMMTDLDGPAVFDRLRAATATAHIPVVFMTANGRPDDAESWRARGAVGVILKPFDPIGLAAEVREILAAARST